MSLRLGIAVREITPPSGLPMGGYAARTSPARGTLDPLCCRALIASDARRTVALVALDVLYLAGGWVAGARERIAAKIGCAPDGILLAATHTHAGPALFSPLQRSPQTDELEERLAREVAAACGQAREAAAEASLYWGVARAAGVASNRRATDDSFDDAVRVVAARDAVGRCRGVLAEFGCHPTVLPPENVLYSRDLFGAAVDAAERLLNAPVVLFNGAAADVSTRFTRRVANAAEMQRLGRVLGEAIAGAAEGAQPMDSVPVGSRCFDVAVRTREPVPPDAAQTALEQAGARLERLRSSAADAGDLRLAQSVVEGAAAQLFLSLQGGAEKLIGRRPETAPLQAVQLGGVDVLAFPGEMFSSAARRIRASRSRPALLVGYANDYLGYFVPSSAARIGGYEALVAVLTPASADAVERELAAVQL